MLEHLIVNTRLSEHKRRVSVGYTPNIPMPVDISNLVVNPTIMQPIVGRNNIDVYGNQFWVNHDGSKLWASPLMGTGARIFEINYATGRNTYYETYAQIFGSAVSADGRIIFGFGDRNINVWHKTGKDRDYTPYTLKNTFRLEENSLDNMFISSSGTYYGQRSGIWKYDHVANTRALVYPIVQSDALFSEDENTALSISDTQDYVELTRLKRVDETFVVESVTTFPGRIGPLGLNTVELAGMEVGFNHDLNCFCTHHAAQVTFFVYDHVARQYVITSKFDHSGTPINNMYSMSATMTRNGLLAAIATFNHPTVDIFRRNADMTYSKVFSIPVEYKAGYRTHKVRFSGNGRLLAYENNGAVNSKGEIILYKLW